MAQSTNAWPSTPQVPVAWGEVFDKWTILVIKSEKLVAEDALSNVARERLSIEQVIGDWHRYPATLMPLVEQLRQINEQLWNIEDGKRDCERRSQFDARFIELARQVYLQNDERARVKKEINTLLGSSLMEEKSYSQY